MKNYRRIFLILFVLSGVPTVILAADFNMDIDSTGSSELKYDFKSQYINMKIESLMFPSEQEPQWYKKIFVKRKNYGIGYFEFSFIGGTKIKQIIYQYEKVSSREYKYEYLLPKEHFPAYILDKIITGRPISMKLVIKNWENKENISLIKNLMSKLNLFSSSMPNIASPQLAQVLQVGTIALDFVETAYPPTNTEESGTITIDPEKLRNQFIITMRDSDGNINEFTKVVISTNASLFQETGGLFDETLKEYPEIFDQKELKIWEKSIRDADNQSIKDISSLINTISSYSNYIKSLELTNTDKVILLAKSLCRWAPKTQEAQRMSAKQFSMLSVDGAQNVLNDYQNSLLKGCSFPGGDCSLPITCAAYDFYSKSETRVAKNFAKSYILGSFQLQVDDEAPIDISLEEYLESFYITGSSSWTPSGSLKNRKYTFDKRGVKISYKNKKYDGYIVSISIIQEDGKYYITQIQLKS